LGGCGTRADSPLGMAGTITIKTINKTSNTSIIGVTLICEDIAPAVLLFIVMAVFPFLAV